MESPPGGRETHWHFRLQDSGWMDTLQEAASQKMTPIIFMRHWTTIILKMKRNNYYRGIKGIEFIWHGSTPDPELSYQGKVVNYYDVENTIWEEYKEDGHDPDDEEKFTQYCQRHEAEIKQLILDIYESGK